MEKGARNQKKRRKYAEIHQKTGKNLKKALYKFERETYNDITKRETGYLKVRRG